MSSGRSPRRFHSRPRDRPLSLSGTIDNRVKSYRIGVIGGDGIGPEVTAAALRALDACEQRFGFRTERTTFPWSGAHFLATGERLTLDKMAPIRAQDAVALGPIRHP